MFMKMKNPTLFILLGCKNIVLICHKYKLQASKIYF